MRTALEAQRKAERDFVGEARRSETAPKGWPAALTMFHLGMWRERMRDALTAVSEGRDYQRFPANVDEFNDRELAHGIGIPLIDAADRADHLMGELIEAYEKIGERPFEWSISKTTTEAVLRNSYTHPRRHMFDYYVENGMPDRGRALFTDAVTDMRTAGAPPLVMGTVIYNLACVRAQEGRSDDALELLREAITLRPGIKQDAPGDSDFGELRQDPRFQELVKT